MPVSFGVTKNQNDDLDGKIPAASMRPTGEAILSGLPLRAMISGPLLAVIDATRESSLSTLEFIRQFGFKGGDSMDNFGEPHYVSFKISKRSSSFQPKADTKQTIEVPILAMLPVPTFRITELNIKFVMHITSIRSSNRSAIRNTSDFSFSGKTQESSDSPNPQTLDTNTGVDDSFTVMGSVQTQQASSKGIKTTREYSLKVDLKFVDDPVNPGLELLLQALSSSAEVNQETQMDAFRTGLDISNSKPF
eukprot:CAMPEP_0177650308 /NCGR_PEP_ID=MMETSP0447-20121125/11872_1 /TAXON_ID=0 /ORGANISM="Stygamoeba regulata, Strain BSH-02190019" /LENGTH=248 /DNA_ID=CAMNT_0019153167 /DNA_START=5 /DNA_END=751 /DNA_ORIENTATION=+